MFKIKGKPVVMFGVEIDLIFGVNTFAAEVSFEDKPNVTLRQVEDKKDIIVYVDGIKE